MLDYAVYTFTKLHYMCIATFLSISAVVRYVRLSTLSDTMPSVLGGIRRKLMTAERHKSHAKNNI